jgi:AAA+ ATPase superfamily predicted ATPase
MFIGRKSELNTLNNHYNNNNFEFFCIYGRRRVGKTELIKEFVKDKKTIFFTGAEDTKDVNLTLFSQTVRETLYGVKSKSVYLDFKDARNDIYEYAKNERLVLVIDEYPYLANSYSGISSLLQIEIDHRLKDTNIFIILCGSSMSFMEKQVMGHKSPLYGRRTGQIKLLPFDYETSAEFFPHLKSEDKAIAYGITGGIAKYLHLFCNNKNLDDNIITNLFNSNELLFEEPANLLKQELREPAMYNTIITAVAKGCSKVNEISTKTGLDSATCVKYLSNLVELGIIKREIPILEKETSKKSIYRLNDGMFRFWYKFVYENISAIQLGFGKQVFADIKPQISNFMGEVFEQICKEYIWKNEMSFTISNVGRWWGNNPIKKCQQEIDLIAVDNSRSKAIFCECKWRNEKMAVSDIDNLLDKTKMFSYKEKYYYFFSKSGFTDAAESLKDKLSNHNVSGSASRAIKMKSENIILIKFRDMFELETK